MTRPIDGWARQMLERQGVFGTLATISADGTPLQAVIWYLVRGDTLVINSKAGRLWPTNLLRDPRACRCGCADRGGAGPGGYWRVGHGTRLPRLPRNRVSRADGGD